jgi:excisionase family DNA binding protein
MNDDGWIPLSAALAELKHPVSEGTLKRLIRLKKIPAARLGRVTLIRRGALAAFLSSQASA